MAEITVKYDDKVIEKVVTEKKRISIGRTHENDIVLENRGVSRKHALIEFNNNAAVIIDNESLNGTFVNSRKISEEVLRDDDIITIGKYSLTYKTHASVDPESGVNFDGTMVLNTKKQKKLLENDKAEKELIDKYGCSLLIGLENTTFNDFRLDREVVTLGKAKFVHIPVKGFMVSKIQAKISRENHFYVLTNLGRKNKTVVNGLPVTQYNLKNGDIISIGNSTFRFIEGKND
jgi:pSer/pThr/pTyr-binding forkhead associated (FHA) protein